MHTNNSQRLNRSAVFVWLGKHWLSLLILQIALAVSSKIIVDGYSSWQLQRVHNQKQLSYAADSAAMQIADNIRNVRHSLQLFVLANKDVLQPLQPGSHNTLLMSRLREAAEHYFPEHLGLILANANGAPVASLGLQPDQACLDEIRQFVQQQGPYRPHLHTDTATTHYNMMVGWGDADGVLVLSFRPEMLAPVLRDLSSEEHNLLLTGGDENRQIELAGQPTDFRQLEIDSLMMGISAGVANTRWVVTAIPNVAYLHQRFREVYVATSVNVTALLTAALLLIMVVEQGRRKRELAEADFRKTHDDLETQVRQRTESLQRANEALEREIRGRRQSQALMLKLSMAVEQTDDSVVITDRNGCIEYVNQAFERVTGYCAADVLGKTPTLVRSGRHSADFYRHLWSTIRSGQVFHEVMINRRKSGELYYEEKTITPLKEPDGEITHYVSTGKDITERTRLQERLHHLSNRDALTGLPNRAMFMDRLNHALASARRQASQFGLLFIDLDQFKSIVDTLGHAAGDSVLEEMGKRLRSCVRESDTLARLGGDEFALILEGVRDSATVAAMAQLLLEQLSRPCQVAEREIQLTASIGITMFPGDADDSEALTRNADVAMYRAKELGRNNYQFFTAELTHRAMQRMDMENRLRHALERGEFSLQYQPKINLNDGSVYGMEALLRWHNPELGSIGPDQFIPILEANGMITRVGDWVLAEACQFARRLHERGYHISLAVNLSARQIKDGGLADRIERLLSDLKLAPDMLELEITESLLIENMAPAVQELGRLNALGVRVSVDDFGTGYSSLGYLKRLPINTLKVDRSFVRDLPGDAEDAAITSAIVALAHSLELSVVAEGVETHEQADFLRELGCEQGQGYLFSRPLAADPLLKWLAQASSICRVGVR